jgi:4-hydroxy-2-oxoheptanedioate aldolase
VWDHPKLIEARRRVAEAAVAHGKFAGTVGSAANLDELVAMGYRFLSVGADVVGLSQYCKGVVAEFTKRPAPPASGIYGGKA